MAITSNLYGPFALKTVQGLIPLTTGSTKLKIMLLKNTYTPNQDTHGVLTDISTHEITGTGYTTGGKLLTGVTVTYDSSTKSVKIDAADAVWTSSTLTARYAVVYYADSAVLNPLIGFIDFGQDISSYLGDFSVVFNALGIAAISLV